MTLDAKYQHAAGLVAVSRCWVDDGGYHCPQCMTWVPDCNTFTFNSVEYLLHQCPAATGGAS